MAVTLSNEASLRTDNVPLTLLEARAPVVFDIPVRSPTKAAFNSPAKARLESYSLKSDPPVNLSHSCASRLKKEVLAEKAREANAKKREIFEKTRALLLETAEMKRREIDRDFEEKQQRREAHIKKVSSPTGSSQGKIALFHEQESQAAMEKKVKIEDTLAQKQEKRREVIEKAQTRAGQHNEKVIQRVKSLQLEQQDQHESKRRDIDRDLDEHCQRRDARLLKVSSPKGNEAKLALLHEHDSQAALELKAKIEDSLAQKEEKRKEVIQKAQARAGQHNEQVIQRVKNLQLEQQDQHESKRRDIDRDLDEHCQRRDARLLKVSSPKGNEGKIALLHEQESQVATELKAKIEDSLAQKQEKRKEVIQKAQSRAGQHNEKVFRRVKSLQLEQQDQHEAKRRDINRDLDEHCQRRDALLLKMSSPKSNEGKIALLHQQESQAAIELKAKIEGSLAQKEEKRKEVIEKAQARAGQHNEMVYQKKKTLEQDQREKQEELRQKLEHKKGSKVSGELYSHLDKSRPTDCRTAEQGVSSPDEVGPKLTVSEARSPVAFDIPMRSLKKADYISKAKARLEGYSLKSDTPRNLSHPCSNKLKKEITTEKARVANAKKREVVEKSRALLLETTEAKRRELECDIIEKQQRREARIKVSSATASRQGKIAFFHKQELLAAMQKKTSIEDSLVQKTEKRAAMIDKAQVRARKHNEMVYQKKMSLEQNQRKKQEELKQKLEQKKGSKVRGEVYSYLDKSRPTCLCASAKRVSSDEVDPKLMVLEARAPVAFDIPMRSLKTADFTSKAKARLESYSVKSDTSLNLPYPCAAALKKEVTAEKARVANAKKREVVEKTRALLLETTEAQRRELECDIIEKQQRRDARIKKVSSAAASSQGKIVLFQEQQLQALMMKKASIEKSLAQKTEKRAAVIEKAQARAREHNEMVYQKKKSLEQKQRKKQEELEQRLEQKKGSKISGEAYSQLHMSGWLVCPCTARTEAPSPDHVGVEPTGPSTAGSVAGAPSPARKEEPASRCTVS